MSVCGNQGRTENKMIKQSVDLNGTARSFLPDYTVRRQQVSGWTWMRSLLWANNRDLCCNSRLVRIFKAARHADRLWHCMQCWRKLLPPKREMMESVTKLLFFPPITYFTPEPDTKVPINNCTLALFKQKFQLQTNYNYVTALFKKLLCNFTTAQTVLQQIDIQSWYHKILS